MITNDVMYIGDVHAEFPHYRNIISNTDLPTIQVGDFGCGFSTEPTFDIKHRFIRGNHDKPLNARNHPNWIPDGHSEVICGFTHYFIGGAFSIDRDQRTQGKNWWEDEELSYAELQEQIDRYIELKPDVVISHDCPSSIGFKLLHEMAPVDLEIIDKPNSRTAAALEQMYIEHPPKFWVFGHYHYNWAHKSELGTLFRCVRTLCTVTLSELLENA